LEKTILSVLNQNYPNLEYIIIDGGSTDNSVEIIKKYSHKLTYWVSEKDNGIYDALQKGFDKTTGGIMAWINADDMYHRNSFFIVSEIFSNFSCVKWLLGASVTWDEYDRGVDVSHSRKFTKYDFLMGDYRWLQQESCFWRRSLWEKAGARLDTSLRYAGDFDLWMRFFNFEKLYVVNALIGGFRQRTKNQLSLEGLPEYLKEADAIVRNQKINKKDSRIIKCYKLLRRFINILNKYLFFRMLNTDRLLNGYRRRYFGFAGDIWFDRNTQSFILS
jgi:glycosyltransferase involved in cell wall biosynthesis